MALRQVLFSVVNGPSRDLVEGSANTSQKLHFVCCDEMGDLSEFDLTIGDVSPLGRGMPELIFAAQDMAGLTWSLTYDPEKGCGDMMRNFGKNG